MKLIFISDIHGSLKYTRLALEAFEREDGDYLLILGDALYHGPRNPLPEEYNPKEVARLLVEYSNKVIMVRGNCDSEVDAMMLEQDSLMDYHIILTETKRIFITHGHIYNEEHLPRLDKGDVFIYGHTHIPVLKEEKGIHIINPGSISIPKGESRNSYGVLDKDEFFIKELSGEIILSKKL